uniref:hypothetical protein n=1 Tax=Mesorhizobium sp. WSM4875 TaxID=3038539 RepID=UPI00241773C6|nr:hypothetical protein [Mesorhizobium sp. WSM4875]WIE94736.1 hypothetical protein P9270_029840 [Mesorhizobium sp. WSM4875]
MNSPSGTRIEERSVGLGRRLRWSMAVLAYRWAKRQRYVIGRRLDDIDAERMRVLQAMARAGRPTTEIHAMGAAVRLWPLEGRLVELFDRSMRVGEWLRWARSHALCARRRTPSGR